MRLGLVSDVHWPAVPGTRASWHAPFDFAGLPARLDRARAVFRRARVDAVVVCGDLTHDGDAPSARAALARLGRPVLAVAGNHDCAERDDLLARCGATMLEPDGTVVGGARVAGVPIARDDATGAFGWAGAPDARDGPTGAFGWAGAPDARAAVVVSHFPVLSRAERLAERGLAYPGDLAGRPALADALGGGDPVVVLSGHIHAREAHAAGTLLQLSAGALVEPPHEVAIVDVGAGRVRRRVSLLGPPPAPGGPVFAPADETWAFAGGAWRPA